MKKLLLLASLVLSGCGVSAFEEHNWIPDTSSRGSDFMNCYERSQQPSYFANTNFAVGQVKPKASFINTCMKSQRYSLRSITGTELGISIVTLPISVAAILAAPSSADTVVNFW
jgi:hypothetical protein